MNEDFDTEVSILVNELPKLDSAMKNMVALLSAKSILTNDSIPALELLNCARVILKCLNEHHMIDVVEWGSLYPQGPTQTAMERIAQLTQYKVARALRSKAQQMGGKPSKLFGKSFILWSGCWNDVRRRCESMPPAEVPDDVFNLFLDTLEASLGIVDARAPKSISTEKIADNMMTDADLREERDGDLIWAHNFTQSLQERRMRRESRIAINRQLELEMAASLADAENQPR